MRVKSKKSLEKAIFTEIYEILQAADENRLKHIEIGKTQENIR